MKIEIVTSADNNPVAEYFSSSSTPETDDQPTINAINGNGYQVPCVDIEYARKLERERDEAREQLSAAKREAEYLATSIHRAEYSNVAPNWGLCDSLAGVISQIDNMYAGVRAQRDEWYFKAHENFKFTLDARAERDEARDALTRITEAASTAS